MTKKEKKLLKDVHKQHLEEFEMLLKIYNQEKL